MVFVGLVQRQGLRTKKRAQLMEQNSRGKKWAELRQRVEDLGAGRRGRCFS